ncbi:cytochrome P450 2K1-like [Sinocyclocheilus rhinocerous]|uniref:cytochrome P450 2K1-like n=1 Tax=Sinocyclocheilus rhinocerous TaxID=307959 RepID=UPI0007B91FA0|nr:PREDICTED: cytochrome P450 2K1-like [Sinocyclocheilus rhinocerous]
MIDLRYIVMISLTMALVQPLFMHVSITGALFATVLLFLVIYLFSISSSSQDVGKYPPGLKPLPLLGNLHMLNLKKTYMSLWELSKQYGSVFTVHFGPKKVVILSGYKAVKQALVNLSEEFGDRDITPIIHDFNQGFGISFSNGENWREMRRFALANLRDFGMGKKRSEQIITEETQYLKEEFEEFEGKPFDTAQPVNLAVSNIISTIVYGSRFEYNNTELHHMVRRAYTTMEMIGSASVQRSSESATLFHSVNLHCTINNLFAAGTDTMTTTLCWGLLLMAKYPEIQGTTMRLCDRVIGRRQPVVENRKNLPYTDAVIHETQRFANIVCVVFICASADFTFLTELLSRQYKGLQFTKDIHSHDSIQSFHLLRIGVGLSVRRTQSLSGRRVCPGESLARMELFLFFTSLLQHFRFTPPPGVSGDELDRININAFSLFNLQSHFVERPSLSSDEVELNRDTVVKVKIGGNWFKALVDSGSSQTLVRSECLGEQSSLIQGKLRVRCIHGDVREYPETDLVVEIENQSYVLSVGIVEQAPYPVILGRDVPILVDLLQCDKELAEMREKMDLLVEMVQFNMAEAQQRQKTWYDRSSRKRTLVPGQKVLLLLPTSDTGLLAKWQGPYEVRRKVSPTNYEISLPDRRKKSQVFHINLLRSWHESKGSLSDQLWARAVEEEEELEEQYFPTGQKCNP